MIMPLQIGRVVGRDGQTIKSLQTYTGTLIQIDQTVDPVRITISGTPHALSLTVSMVRDIISGCFKGFALLRQSTQMNSAYPAQMAQPVPRPVYAPVSPGGLGRWDCLGGIPAAIRVAPPRPPEGCWLGLRPPTLVLAPAGLWLDPAVPGEQGTRQGCHG